MDPPHKKWIWIHPQIQARRAPTAHNFPFSNSSFLQSKHQKTCITAANTQQPCSSSTDPFRKKKKPSEVRRTDSVNKNRSFWSKNKMTEQRLFFSHHALDDLLSPFFFSTCLASPLIPPLPLATFDSFRPPWPPRSPWRPEGRPEILISKLSSMSPPAGGARPLRRESGWEKRRAKRRPRKHASMARTIITERAMKTGPKEPLGCGEGCTVVSDCG